MKQKNIQSQNLQEFQVHTLAIIQLNLDNVTVFSTGESGMIPLKEAMVN